MLTQTRRIAVPCVSLMMAATGTVCPRKNAAVVVESVSARDAELALDSHLAFQMRVAILAANDIMLTLNTTCSGFHLPPDFGQHCTAVDTDAIKIASTELRLTTAISRNGRLTDMLPSIPGSLTFMRDVAAASPNRARA